MRCRRRTTSPSPSNARTDGDHRDADWTSQILHWVEQHIGTGPHDWRLASVQRSVAATLTEALSDHRPDESIRHISHLDVPLALAVDHPERVGIDRLLGCFAAISQGGPPLVVVDAGSAVTVDWISPDNVYCGGAILPGLQMQARSLASGTDLLPQLSWDRAHITKDPPTNTVAAIHTGILISVASAVDAFTQRYVESSGKTDLQAQVVITGGDAAAISPHICHPHSHIPNLVCRGLLDLPRSGQTKLDSPAERH